MICVDAGDSGRNTHVALGVLVLTEGQDWGITSNVPAFICVSFLLLLLLCLIDLLCCYLVMEKKG